jgi:OHCU decarboxylase
MPDEPITLALLNTCERDAFIDLLAPAVEHARWVADRVYFLRPFVDVEDLAQKLLDAIRAGTDDEKLTLLRSQPDLPARLQLSGALPAEEIETFQLCSTAYREKFGFPLVMAAGVHQKDEMFADFTRRLENPPEQELQIALEETARQAAQRIAAQLTDPARTTLLADHACGFGGLVLTRVLRYGGKDETQRFSIDVRLRGGLEPAFIASDHTQMLAAQQMKDLAIALAREHTLQSIEQFAADLSARYLGEMPQVSLVTVEIQEDRLQRLRVGETRHPHAFAASPEHRFCIVERDHDGVAVRGGLRALQLIATAAAPAGRTIAATLDATWNYIDGPVDFAAVAEAVRRVIVETFADAAASGGAIEQLVREVAEAALLQSPEIDQIALELRDHSPAPAAGAPPGELFVASDPFVSTISATVRRS